MNIVVFCNAGLSSSLIVSRMKQVAAPEDVINAYQSTMMEEMIPQADVVLISPGLSYILSTFKEIASPLGIPCEAIDMRAYGTCNGADVYKQALKMYQSKEK